jgi:hypothetical protein
MQALLDTIATMALSTDACRVRLVRMGAVRWRFIAAVRLVH